MKISRLTFETVCLTSIERQKVETYLQVFCDKTISALKLHPEFKDAKGTIYFLNAVLEFYKMINVHSKFTALQTRDNLRTVITSSNDIIIQKLQNFNFIIQNMHSFGGKKLKA